MFGRVELFADKGSVLQRPPKELVQVSLLRKNTNVIFRQQNRNCAVGCTCDIASRNIQCQIVLLQNSLQSFLGIPIRTYSHLLQSLGVISPSEGLRDRDDVLGSGLGEDGMG